MGIYLYARGTEDSVKVSGPLADVVPVRVAPSGSMPADEFLSRLAQAEASWEASSPWRELVTSGMLEKLAAQAATEGLAAGDATSPSGLFLQQRKFSLARILGEAALQAGQPVCWN